MTRSISVSANFVGKLHVALLQAPRHGITVLSPTIDGAYIVTTERERLLEIMRHTFISLARLFIAEKNRYRQFLVRGGIAYGPVVIGNSFGEDESKVFAQSANRSYRDTLLIGMPVVQAYEVESAAPPFGVAVHITARAFAPEGSKPLRSAYWRWFEKNQELVDVVDDLKAALKRYFSFMAAHETELDYPKEDQDRHSQLWHEYFWPVDDEKGNR